ncbi:alpha/beta fold hydrolase [Rathayibacter sp. VKM Ac-2762]|uniref:alpha/beta fold hydrolase n=1 Tax=Rathayibacter sp. VKM Ac-2762 TaxID=2609254 RepID=UPI00132EBBF9|nr:alpha/beta hydrolase [Rathayibacter sp. VKM Ac-2762]QHF20813.1 alpha/beta fold hydrolase [Rathayibacter sp. VKM Ac-2762]
MLQVRGESGQAVLLLPGGGEAVDGFFPGLVEGLIVDPGCRVVLYDRPGTAGSEVAGGLTDAADAVHAVLAGLGTGPVVVIGQSLGGAVAMLLARDHPEDVAGLVLLDPTPVNDTALARQVERTARATATLARLPGLGRALSALLRTSAARSARRHAMSPAARAAALAMADVDLPGLASAAAGLEQVARGFDESQLPAVPAAVVTADRRPGSSLHRAHRRVAAALDAPLLSWPGAVHEVHLSHEREVLEVARAIVRAVASD